MLFDATLIDRLLKNHFSNPALQGIAGLTEDEILMMNPFDLVHPADREWVRQRAAKRLAGLSPPDDYEFRILTTDTMTDGLSIQDREGVITQVNRRLREISGFARRELIGRPLSDLFVKREDPPEEIAANRGDPVKLEAETFLYHKDGRRIAVSLKIDSLIDDDDNHKGSFVFFSDISELRMLRRHQQKS